MHEDETAHLAILAITRPIPAIWQALQRAYSEDTKLASLLSSIQQNPAAFPDYTIKDRIVLFKGRIMVPANTALQHLLIFEFHNTPVGGHDGGRRTYNRIAGTFFWPSLKRQVQDFVASCRICQSVKPFNRAPQGLLQPLPLPGKIWESLSLDFITHLPSSAGKTVILVVMDRLSKQAHFSAMPSKFTALQVAEIFARDIIRLHGVPVSLVSDRDPLFMSQFWKELFRLQGTQLSMSSAYHPQSDGQTEILNRYLEDYLRCFTSDHPRQWYHLLSWAEWHYNTA